MFQSILPSDLPNPLDDGACDHLKDMPIPNISLPNQDDNLNVFKLSSSGGSQINYLNSMVNQFGGKVDSVDDFRSENAKAPQHMKNASDYFYRLAMGVHDPAVIRDAKLFGSDQLNTKTKAMIKVGKEAVPIIAKIGIKVALAV